MIDGREANKYETIHICYLYDKKSVSHRLRHDKLDK